MWGDASNDSWSSGRPAAPMVDGRRWDPLVVRRQMLRGSRNLAAAAVDLLIDTECEALAALHAVIPHTGQEPRSEALEHLLEHVIMRKQEQVDTLLRARGGVTTAARSR